MAENVRQDVENFHKHGELQAAVTDFTRAVTIRSNKMPSYPRGGVLRIPTSMEGRYRNLALVSYSSACG